MGLDRAGVRAGEHDDLVDDFGSRQPLEGVVDERGVGEGQEGLGALEGDGAEGLEGEKWEGGRERERGGGEEVGVERG